MDGSACGLHPPLRCEGDEVAHPVPELVASFFLTFMKVAAGWGSPNPHSTMLRENAQEIAGNDGTV